MGNLWVIGDSVQDITVEIDLEQLSRKHDSDHKIQLHSASVRIEKGTVLHAQSGPRRFEATIDVKIENKDGKMRPEMVGDFFELLPGDKYILERAVREVNVTPPSGSKTIVVHCEDVSWGGGGLNAVQFIRSLSSDPSVVPITYTDIAMEKNPADEFFKKYQGMSASSDKDQLIKALSKFSGDRYLELHLKSINVATAFIHPTRPSMRLNWVISRVHSSEGEIHNKIICKSALNNYQLQIDWVDVDRILAEQAKRARVVFMNSLKNQELIRRTYKALKSQCRPNCPTNPVGIFAMTESMHDLQNLLYKDLKADVTMPELTLVFNESEFVSYARRFVPKRNRKDVEEFMSTADAMPNLQQFAKLVNLVTNPVLGKHQLTLVVTLGSRGSFCVTSDKQVLYVATYAKPRATIFDTNKCGDAFCGTLALLLWGDANGKVNSNGDFENNVAKWTYFLRVATATAYAKATNRRGNLDLPQVSDLLENWYLASAIKQTPTDILDGTEVYVKRPEEASMTGVSIISDLIG